MDSSHLRQREEAALGRALTPVWCRLWGPLCSRLGGSRVTHVALGNRREAVTHLLAGPGQPAVAFTLLPEQLGRK